MLDASRRICNKVTVISRTDFDDDDDLQLALVHLIQVVGEAASGVSAESRAQLSSIVWQDIVSMRNRIVHDYLNIDLDVVWETAHRDIPTLIAELEQVVPPPPREEAPSP